MNKPEEAIKTLTAIETVIMKMRSNDIQTKYKIKSLFTYCRKLINYQVPTPPIDVSEDGHKFTCPTCETAFDTEDHVDDFNLCYICGQRWKE